MTCKQSAVTLLAASHVTLRHAWNVGNGGPWNCQLTIEWLSFHHPESFIVLCERWSCNISSYSLQREQGGFSLSWSHRDQIHSQQKIYNLLLSLCFQQLSQNLSIFVHVHVMKCNDDGGPHHCSFTGKIERIKEKGLIQCRYKCNVNNQSSQLFI